MKICKNCNKEFPFNIKLNNKRINLSKRIYCLECSPLNSNNRKQIHKIKDNKKLCKKCNLFVPIKNYYKYKDKIWPYCIICEKNRVKEKLRNFKQLCIDYKGGKCNLCGYNKCIAALDFHHKDPKNKKINISKIQSKKLTINIIKELDKCEILCSNCHRELHYKEEI